MSADPASGQRFPGRATLLLDYPHAAHATVRLVGHGAAGASFRLVVDGAVLAERRWPATPDGQARHEATAFGVPLTAGRHTLTLENPQGEDWFELGAVDTGLTCSPLAAVGRRAADQICLWVWHRTGVYRAEGAAPVEGCVVLDDLPTGRWRATWWDLTAGEPQTPTDFTHAGGTFRLPTSAIGRHAAVSLERLR